ncbi:hypothetical protein ACFM35_13130 [Microbacterium sp. P01]|uniref:hypothetical protein n=1 Tax=Microbacterium sp. P01 TaxID=3366261 RepID=UPI00366BCD73
MGGASIVLIASLSACAAPGLSDGQAPVTPSSQSSWEPSPTITTTTTPLPLTPPPTAADEIARATFDAVGAGGVPESTSTSVDVLRGGQVLLEGRCDGERVRFRLTTAATGEDQRPLYEGTMLCSGALSTIIESGGYAGPVQLSIIDATDADAAWVLARSS